MEIEKDFTELKTKIETDKLEIKQFIMLLYFYSQKLSLETAEPLVKRELNGVCKRIYKKLKNPNISDLKKMSFSYYECSAIEFVIKKFHKFGLHLSFDQVAIKIDQKYSGIKKVLEIKSNNN